MKLDYAGWHPLTQSQGDLADEQLRGQKECLSCSFRGSVIWTLWDEGEGPYIVCTHIRKEGKGFFYRHLLEQDFPDVFTCPRRYIEATTPINISWREKVKERFACRGVITQLRNEFKKREKNAEKGLRVYLKPLTPGKIWNIPYALIISDKPLIGIYKGRKYLIPSRAIDYWEEVDYFTS